jgi:electron transfer flavoprotein alpha subunit
MAELLLIGFEKSDCGSLVAFANAYGKSFDLIALGENGTVPPADALAKALADKAGSYSVVAFPATMAGKDVAPRVAALLDLPMVSDIVGIEAEDKFLRPMFAGNVTAKVRVDGGRFVATVRSTAFQGAEAPEAAAFSLPAEGATKRVSVDEAAGGRPDLAQAKVVVSGGRPLKDAETFERLIGGLADKLGGAAGATRAAVDSGIAANELQVGQTGKIVAPGLYIAAGISGSTQHMAGMKDSKVIVAINTDSDAPIFEIADFGLVMDLHEAIPQLIEKL